MLNVKETRLWPKRKVVNVKLAGGQEPFFVVLGWVKLFQFQATSVIPLESQSFLIVLSPIVATNYMKYKLICKMAINV